MRPNLFPVWCWSQIAWRLAPVAILLACNAVHATTSAAVTGRAYPRGDTDCSLSNTAADVVAQLRVRNGVSACGNDDCNRDGDTDGDDVTCTAGCIFGTCPVPPHAPSIGGVSAGTAPGLSPFSTIRLSGSGFGSGEKAQSVTIGGRFGEVVGEADGDMRVVVPDLPPGCHDLVFLDGDLASAPFPIDIAASETIGSRDSFEDVATLVLEAVDALLAPELDTVYGESADVVRRELQQLRSELPADVASLLADPDFTGELRSEIDGWLEGSGLAEHLREAIAALSPGAARGRVPRGPTVVAGATRVVQAVASAGRTTLLAGKTITVAAGEAGAATTLVVIGGKVVAIAAVVGVVAAGTIAVTEDTPVIRSVAPSLVEPGETITLTGSGFGGFVEPNLVFRTRTGETVTVRDSESASEDAITFRVPIAVGVCGALEVALELPLIGRSSPTPLPLQIALVIDSLTPDVAKPDDRVEVRVRGWAGCALTHRSQESLRQAEGEGRTFAMPIRDRRENPSGDVTLGIRVPAIVPGLYELFLSSQDVPDSNTLTLTVDTDLRAIDIECPATTLRVNEALRCSVRTEPGRLPAGRTFIEISATPDGVVENDSPIVPPADLFEPTRVVFEGDRPGTATVDVALRRADITPPRLIVGQAAAIELTVVDDFAPTVEEVVIDEPPGADPDALTPVDPGSRIQITVTGRDNLEMAALRVLANGDAIAEGPGDPPRVQEHECPPFPVHSRTCTAIFAFQVRDGGFVGNEITLILQAFDAEDNAATPREVRFAVDVPLGAISGTVRDAETLQPIDDATVRLFDVADAFVAETSTVDGAFAFEEVPAGSYTVEAERGDFSPAAQAVEVEADESATVDLRLEPRMGPIVELQRIATSARFIPPGVDRFSDALVENGRVVSHRFVQNDPESTGIYLHEQGENRLILQEGLGASIDGGVLGFTQLSEDRSVFVYDLETGDTRLFLRLPGSPFGDFSSVVYSGGRVGFIGRTRNERLPNLVGIADEGIDVLDQSNLTIIADADTPIPSGPGTFTDFSTRPGSIAYDAAADTLGFIAHFSDGQSGVYATIAGGPLRSLADTDTPGPEGTGFLESFADVAVDGESVAFRAVGPSSAVHVVYAYEGGRLRVVAQTGEPIPGTDRTFSRFLGVAHSGGVIAFGSSGLSTDGLVIERDGQLSQIVVQGDLLDGDTLNQVVLSGDGAAHTTAGGTTQIVFEAIFPDRSGALYLATIR